MTLIVCVCVLSIGHHFSTLALEPIAVITDCFLVLIVVVTQVLLAYRFIRD